MNKAWLKDKKSPELIQKACDSGALDSLAEEYIVFCHTFKENEEEDEDASSSKKKKQNDCTRFPNVAGFCRYFGIGQQKFERLSKKYPEEFEKLSAILEDEALNSEISASVLTAYLKKRLGYSDSDKPEKSEIDTGQMRLVFEHDILSDGE